MKTTAKSGCTDLVVRTVRTIQMDPLSFIIPMAPMSTVEPAPSIRHMTRMVHKGGMGLMVLMAPVFLMDRLGLEGHKATVTLTVHAFPMVSVDPMDLIDLMVLVFPVLPTNPMDPDDPMDCLVLAGRTVLLVLIDSVGPIVELVEQPSDIVPRAAMEAADIVEVGIVEVAIASIQDGPEAVTGGRHLVVVEGVSTTAFAKWNIRTAVSSRRLHK